MKYSARIAGVCLTAMVLTACGGGNAPAPAVPVPPDITSPGAMPFVKHPPQHDIYVVDYGSKLVKEIPEGCRYASCVATIGTGFSCPTFVSHDASLDLFVSNTCDYNTAAYKMAPGCSERTCASKVPGDYLNPLGIVSDRHGNLYVADYSHGYVHEVPAGCKKSSCVVELGGDAFVGPGYVPWDYGPSDIALDKHGNVYVASYYYVSEMSPHCKSAKCVTRLGGGWYVPWNVSLDGDGNIYVNDRENREIKEMPPHCQSASCVNVVMGGFSDPVGVKVDARDNVYVSDDVSLLVSEIPKGCRASPCMVTIGGGFTEPFGIAIGP